MTQAESANIWQNSATLTVIRKDTTRKSNQNPKTSLQKTRIGHDNPCFDDRDY